MILCPWRRTLVEIELVNRTVLTTALSVREGYNEDDLTSSLSMRPVAIAVSRASSAEFGGAYSIVCKVELLSTNDKAIIMIFVEVENLLDEGWGDCVSPRQEKPTKRAPIPTMPRPATKISFRGGGGILVDS